MSYTLPPSVSVSSWSCQQYGVVDAVFMLDWQVLWTDLALRASQEPEKGAFHLKTALHKNLTKYAF
jgi:hypothetical protein